MFWVYVVGLFFPPVVLHRAIVRRLDELDDGGGSIMAAIILFMLQAVLLFIGGWIATTIAVLIFAYACLLAYAMWGPEGKREQHTAPPVAQNTGFKRAAPLPSDWKTRLNFKHQSHDDTASPIVTGRSLDVIRFDYLNQKGEYSSRRVKVTMVGAWHFEGIDLDKHAERTFRHERVVGDITSEKTGEVLDSESWAEGVRAQAASGG